MNYISHHEVARLYDPDATPDFLLGSFVSDFARIAGSRGALLTIENPDIFAGIQLHNLTNKPAFDGQPVLREIEDSMQAAFEDFLPHSTARQASSVGKDLLFDGIQFTDETVVAALHCTLEAALNGSIAFGEASEMGAILAVIEYIHTNGPPRYDEVPVVTERLRIVLSKTKTPLLESELPKVDEVLTRHQARVLSVGAQVMDQTVETLKEIYPARS